MWMCCYTVNIISRILPLELVCHIVCHCKCGRFWPPEPKSGVKPEPWVLEARRFEAGHDRLFRRCFIWPVGLAFLNFCTCQLRSIDLLHLYSSRLCSVVVTERNDRPNLVYTFQWWVQGHKMLPDLFSFHKEISPSELGPPHVEESWSHSDTTHSVGILWTSDQPDAETSTWQHTTFPRERYPCLRRDSDAQSQQASGRRTCVHWDRQWYLIVVVNYMMGPKNKAV
jgi:hypothetical protein